MTGRPVPLARMPVLTEVVELQRVEAAHAGDTDHWQTVDTHDALDAEMARHMHLQVNGQVPPPAPVAPPVAPISESQLTQRILADVQRQVDLMVEYRLREALLPALARLTDGLVKDARHELAATLKDVVTRAVSQELAKHRSR